MASELEQIQSLLDEIGAVRRIREGSHETEFVDRATLTARLDQLASRENRGGGFQLVQPID